MEFTDLPSIKERLQDLNPSKELLDFYRNRLIQSENDNEKILKRLAEFKATCDEQFQLEKDLLERDEEIAALRKALSDIQGCLYQEREHVLRLYAENDRLKIRELEDRKKIQQLLLISKEKFPNADLLYLSKDVPSLNTLNKMATKERKSKTNLRTKPKTVEILGSGPQNEADDMFDDTEFLKLQIEALRAELEEQTRLSRENIEALTEDCRVTREESDAQYRKHTAKIQNINEKLKFSQDLLQKMTEDFLDLKRKHKNQEMIWLSNRDELTLHLNTLKRRLSPSRVETSVPPLKTSTLKSTQTSNSQKQEIQALTTQLDKVQKMSECYKSQCLKLESELSHFREEKEASKTLYNERSEKLGNQLKLLNSKYKDLEKRHKLEVEGFKSDIKILRAQLQKVEKQLLKTALKLTQTQDDDVLQSIHTTTTRSKFLFDNLRSLKAQIYQLEHDLRIA